MAPRKKPISTRKTSPRKNGGGGWQPVQSSDVAAYKYDRTARELRVRFVKTGEYVGRDIRPGLARDFGVSASKGKYFYNVLRPLGFTRG